MVKRSEDSQEIDPLAVETLATFENLKRDIDVASHKNPEVKAKLDSSLKDTTNSVHSSQHHGFRRFFK